MTHFNQKYADPEVGLRLGLLLIVDNALRMPNGRHDRAARVRCVCGAEWLLKVRHLLGPNPVRACRSCRLFGREDEMLVVTHRNMLARTANPHHPKYALYGGRGITVHPDLLDRSAFIEYIRSTLGPRPARHSLDRIDNERGYEPGNLRWADGATQIDNRRGARVRPPASAARSRASART